MASIFQRPNGKWRADISRGAFKQSKTFTTKSLAEAWARGIEGDLERSLAGLPNKQPLISDIINRYIKEVISYRKCWKHDSFVLERAKKEIWTQRRCDELTRSVVREWCDARLTEVSGSTVNREWNTYQGMFTHAIKHEWINLAGNPWSLGVRPQSNKARDQRVSDADLLAIVGPIPKHKVVYKKDYVPYIAYFAVETLMRIGEICQLRWSDIDQKRGTIWVRDEWTPTNSSAPSTKNGEDREVPLSKVASEIINELSRQFVDAPMDAKLFNIAPHTFYVYWRDASIAAGKKHIHIHDARREGCTRLAPKLPVMTLAKMSGHRDVNILLNTYYNPDMSKVSSMLDAPVTKAQQDNTSPAK